LRTRNVWITVISTLLLFPGMLMAEDEEGDVKAGERKGKFLPFPVVFYTPETGMGFGAGALYLAEPLPGAVVQEPDTVNGIAFYTVKNQLLVAAIVNKYLVKTGDKLNLQGIVQKFPDEFWGIGPDTPDTAEESYTPQEFAFTLGYQWMLTQSVYLGPEYTFSSIKIKEVEEGGLLDAGGITGSDSTLVSVIGGRMTLDNRDSRIYARRGCFFEAALAAAGRFIGSTENFGQADFDYRRYFPLFRDHVFALQYILQLRTGTVPFEFLPKLGGQNIMRGYLDGRYRDRHYTALQGEYRLPLFWRLGGVVFGSVGKVGPDISSLISAQYLRASGGLGLRLLLDEEDYINFRFDTAYNGDGLSFYFNVLEAF